METRVLGGVKTEIRIKLHVKFHSLRPEAETGVLGGVKTEIRIKLQLKLQSSLLGTRIPRNPHILCTGLTLL